MSRLFSSEKVSPGGANPPAPPGDVLSSGRETVAEEEKKEAKDQASGRAVNSYDQVPYSVGAFPQTRPERLATLATLFGMTPADPARCRVLELGCASGGNLVPMAEAARGSQFVGVDLSSRQIEEGQRVVRELGLKNLDLRAMSITEIGAEFGKFDYILVHGVYSWVPAAVQEKILAVCRENLAQHGVAYVSYNCLPGWHARGAIREMLLYHTQRIERPEDKVKAARGLLGFLAQSAGQTGDGGYGALMRQELAVLAMTPDTYLLHEHLEDYNEPLYFHEFARRAREQGLQYLGEAQVSAMVPGRFGAKAEETLRRISGDLLHMEQYMDFLRNRMFRQTLLCHAGVKLEYALRPEQVRGMWVASAAKGVAEKLEVRGEGEEQFRIGGAAGTGQTLTTRDAVMKGAMVELGERWPAGVSFEELVERARERAGLVAGTEADRGKDLAVRLLNCFTSGLVEFGVSPPCFCTAVSERPVASGYARLRAREGGKVINGRLETVMLGEPSRLVLGMLDGTRTVEEVVREVERWMAGQAGEGMAEGEAEREERARRYVEEVLKGMARNALLVG